MVISEMTGDLPCPENIFEAQTVSEFDLLAPMLQNSPRCPSLQQLVSALVHGPWSGPREFPYSGLPLSNLYHALLGTSLPFDDKIEYSQCLI